MVLAILVALLPVIGLLGAVSTIPDTPAVVRALFYASDWQQRANDLGVTVIFTDDDRNCGVGCWHPETPTLIYVAPGMSPRATEQVALHELGHVWIYLHPAIDGSECLADRLAFIWGAKGPFSYCGPIVNRS